ncbi:MAG TPA: FtsQ-type POTRA domain-containing protein [Polyangiaceae bacterium]|mgnify:CR=1 FL=1|nr:FtsQ-type POTRA domain-containing protein [Polyangiaceae bacterium]
MTRKKRAHGDHLSAPDENGSVDGESPLPPAAKPRRAVAGQSVPPPAQGTWSKIWSGTKLLAGVLLVVGVSVGVAWGAHRYALTTPRFAIRSVEIQGATKRSEDQILTLMNTKVGDNIFALDTVLAETRVLEDPWIKEVKISRDLPSTLRVELKERSAVALASVGDQVYLITRSGEPFKRLEDGDPYDLPVLTGVTPDGVANHREREVQRLGTGVEVLRHWERIDLSKTYPAQEVHLTGGGDVVLSVGKSGIALHLGPGPWRKKLLMAERVLLRMSAKGRMPGIVFLDNVAHPERVVVRMR